MRRLPHSVFIAFVYLGILVSHAEADDRATCLGPVTDGENVAACTRLIAAGGLDSGELVKVYFQRAISHTVIRGDFDQAIADFNEVIRLDPNNARAYSVRGACFVRKGDLARALVDLEASLRLDPKDASVHSNLSLYYNATGDYDHALAEANEALRLRPQFLYAYQYRAAAHESKGELGAALADFRAALGFDPDKKQIGGREAAEGMARIQQKIAAIGRVDWDACFGGVNGELKIAACTRLITSARLTPGDLSRAYFQRAVSLTVIMSDTDRAIDDLTEVIRLDPKNATAHAIRGAGFVRKGDYDRALSDLNEGRRLDPNNASVHNDFGVYYNAIGDHDRALVELNEAIRLYPQFLYAYKNSAEWRSRPRANSLRRSPIIAWR